MRLRRSAVEEYVEPQNGRGTFRELEVVEL
jgi:hypothetical protein